MIDEYDDSDAASLFGGLVEIWIDAASIHMKINDRGFTTVELNSAQAKEVAEVLQRLASNIE